MAVYNKRAHLSANIKAIKVAFTLDRENRPATPEELAIIKEYSGFGGLKCILSPASSVADVVKWKKSELELFPPTMELHRLIRANSKDEAEYKEYMQSLKSSVLTAFYTPPAVIEALTKSMQEVGINPQKVLEPSAGMGEFISPLKRISTVDSSIFSFEKDLLTGKLLSALHPEAKVRVKGFEEIDTRFNGYFDMVASNIPFGDVSVFDPEFMKSGDVAHKMARQSLHNYFFVKGVETLREGGVLAFITSQGVMNSPTNKPVREWLMNNTNLISAIRLPNNLFSENAGTDVGSDLIVLQKNSNKTELTADEKLFLETAVRPQSGVVWNKYFQQQSQLVQTSWKIDTDPYGKPAITLKHDGGAEGIAARMGRILDRDLKERFSLELYNQPAHRAAEVVSSVAPKPKVKVAEVVATEEVKQIEVKPTPANALFTLFGEVAAQQKPRRRATRVKPQLPEQSEAKTITPIVTIPKATLWWQEDREAGMKPRIYDGDMGSHIREGSMLVSDKQVGVFARDMEDRYVFQPLDLPNDVRLKAIAYIDIRDRYHQLYNFEHTNHEEDAQSRKLLNDNYDNFVKKYGYLNDRKNNDLVQMDASGREILYLERKEGKQTVKADIFMQPVAFNPNELIKVDSPAEALSASLNKSGGVDIDYMSSLLPEISREDMIADLEGKIYFNPMIDDYEITEKFVAGNVIAKAEEVDSYLLQHPDDSRAMESLKALKDATPTPTPFADLDFNFGERWIPTGIYSQFATHLFGAHVDIAYNSSADEYAVNCSSYNATIYDKYCVRAESRTYNGVNLMKHALLNTTPDITKKITVGDKEVKVRDSEAIQMANSKIDEIRGEFTSWLDEQGDDFKEKMEKLYNSKFNCFVRPRYDGSSQNFPDLDLKGLGIPDLYQSQKDAVWMIKQRSFSKVEQNGVTYCKCG